MVAMEIDKQHRSSLLPKWNALEVAAKTFSPTQSIAQDFPCYIFLCVDINHFGDSRLKHF